MLNPLNLSLPAVVAPHPPSSRNASSCVLQEATHIFKPPLILHKLGKTITPCCKRTSSSTAHLLLNRQENCCPRPEGQCNRKANPATGKRGYWTAGDWGLVHINSLTRWRTSISWIMEASREKLLLKDVPSAAFSLFPNGEWQTPFWEKALGAFSCAVRHLVNVLYCVNTAGSNVNVSTHWPGTLFKLSANIALHLTAPVFHAFLCKLRFSKPNRCKHKEFFKTMCFLLTQ